MSGGVGGGGQRPRPSFHHEGGFHTVGMVARCMFFWVYFREHVLFYGFYYFMMEGEEEDMCVVLCTVSCRSADLPPLPLSSQIAAGSFPTQLVCPPLLVFLSSLNQFLLSPFPISIV